MNQKKEIKEVIEKILGASLSVSVTSNTEEEKLKLEFLKTIDLFENVWKRQNMLDNELGLDFTSYDEDFFKVIEGIIHFSFAPTAAEAILFYVYSRYDEDDKLMPFVDEDNEERLFANSEDLWEYLLDLTDKLMMNGDA
tara:strand:+ start:2636 stop:3052 length:417 start_codon:yes stop_codon:yes gene_type:complete